MFALLLAIRIFVVALDYLVLMVIARLDPALPTGDLCPDCNGDISLSDEGAEHVLLTCACGNTFALA